jgi:hypothetical protein
MWSYFDTASQLSACGVVAHRSVEKHRQLRDSLFLRATITLAQLRT